MHIAVFNNDPEELKHIGSLLEPTGHHLFLFNSSKQLLHHDLVDLLILEWHSSLLDVLSQFKEKYSRAVPVLLMTTRTNVSDLAQSLGSSTVDFILKPIHRTEFLTRVHVLLKRTYPEQMSVNKWEYGPYVFDTQSAHVTLLGQSIGLTRKEFDLALLLFQHLNRPLSRAYLSETIWPKEPEFSSRTLDTHISRVRTKLHICAANSFELCAVYGYGYQLNQVGVSHA